MRCSNCNRENAATSNFCISCGNSLKAVTGTVSRVEIARLENQLRELREKISRISEALDTEGIVIPEAVPEPEREAEPIVTVQTEAEILPGTEFEIEAPIEPDLEPEPEPEPVFEPEPAVPVPLTPATATYADPWLRGAPVTQPATSPAATQAVGAAQPVAWETAPPNGPTIPTPSWSFSDFNWEPIIGGNWLARVGALAIIIGVGFFLNLAFENNWIGETGRIILGIVSGLAFLAAGEYWRVKYPAYSQALTGTGIAILYIAIFAAFAIYSLIDIYTGVTVLLLISVTSAVLAIRQNSISLAILGIIGAFMGPFILGASGEADSDGLQGSTGNAFGLLAYIFVVDVGVIVLSTFKSWRWFTALAYAGSLITFGLWLSEYGVSSSALVTEYGRPETQLIAEAGLTSIFLSFVAATTLFHLVWKRNPESRDLTLMLVNASVYIGISYGLLWNDFREWMGGFTIVISLLYAGVGYIALKRVGLVPIDLKNPARDMLLTSISFGIALILLTAAIPIQIGGPWIPVVWAAESVLLMWLSFNQRMPEIRIGALAVLGLAAWWLGIVETPDALRESVTPFWNQYLPAYVAVVAAFWAGAALVRRNSDQLQEIEKFLFPVLAVIGIFFLALGTPVQVSETWLPVAWTLEAVAILWVAFNQRVIAVRYGALAVLALGALWLGTSETPDALRDLPTPFWNHFLPVYLIVIAGIWASAYLTKQSEDQLLPDEKILVPALVLAGIFFLALGTPIQVAQTWLPVAWIVEAVVLMWIAFNRKAPPVRYGALAVLATGAIWLGLVETPQAIDESPTPFWNVQLPVYLIFIAGTWTIAYLVKQNDDQLRQEEKSLFSVVVLVGVFFLALGAPVQMDQSWLPLAWTIEAVVLIWFAFNQKSQVIRYGALAVLAVGAFWLGVIETPDAIRDSHRPFWNNQFTVYIVVIVGIWIAAYLTKRNDDQLKTEESKLYELMAVTGVFFLALGTPVQVSGPWMAFAWSIEGLAVTWIAMRLGIFEALVSGLVLFGLTAIRALGYDSVVDGDGYTVLWNTRLIAFGPLIAGMAVAAYLWRGSVSPYKEIEPAKVAMVMAVVANFFALWFLSAEVIGAVQADALFTVSDSNEADAVSLGLTVLWGVYGGLVLAAGFVGDWRLVRSAGLILLAIPVFKLFLVDSFQLEQGLRVAAFLILGGILLAGGYLYQRNSELIKELFIRPTTPGPTGQGHSS